jgi:hypothetical protein
VLETMRTLFVWAGGLALYYSSGTGKIGERWDNYSYFQVQCLIYSSYLDFLDTLSLTAF